MAPKTESSLEKNDIPLSKIPEKDFEQNLDAVEVSNNTKKNNEVRKPIS